MRLGDHSPLFAIVCASLAMSLVSCGGGTAQSNPAPTVPQQTGDFALSVTPSSVTIFPTAPATLTVSVTATGSFNSTVAVSISGLPSTVTAAPVSLSVTPGTPQTVTLTAAATATAAIATVNFNATSGSLSHAASVALSLHIPPQTLTTRIRYFNTGTGISNEGYIAPVALYNAPSGHFFFVDGSQNQVFAFDGKTQKQLSSIYIPNALSLDQAPDGSVVYVATSLGNIYAFDPSALAITELIKGSQIGPSGYPAFAIFPLADGNFVLMGDPSALGTPSSYNSIAVWNKAGNTVTKYVTADGVKNSLTGQSFCGSLVGIGNITINTTRTKVFVGGYSDPTICQFDPATGQSATANASAITSNGGSTQALPTPDGNFLTFGLGNLYIWDSGSMTTTNQFTFPAYLSAGTGVLSPDGNTLYYSPLDAGVVLAYNWRTFTQIGWASEPIANLNGALVPMVIDNTGLIGGTVGSIINGGFGFADVSHLQTSVTITTQLSNWMEGPYNALVNVGPTSGGTPVQFSYVPSNQSATALYFDYQSVANFAAPSNGSPTAVSPPHAAGTVDLALTTSDGAVFVGFNAFSYGPSATQVIGYTSTAEGGGTASVFGYGLSQQNLSDQPQVQVGAQTASVTSYSANVNGEGGIPYQYVQFTIPPGQAGATLPITISNQYGSTTAPSSITYMPAIQTFPLPGSNLAEGVYDAKHQLYYFTDLTKIQVFSRNTMSWQSPIPLPNPTQGTQDLVGIALSPDGTKMAISDDGTASIYVLDTATLSVLNTFSVASGDSVPCGIAISDSGIVYFASYETTTGGASTFHRLDTSTGIVTSYSAIPAFNQTDQFDSHVLITPDNATVFFAEADTNFLYKVDTATDEGGYIADLAIGLSILVDSTGLTLSPDGTTLQAGGALTDSSGNPLASIGEPYSYGLAHITPAEGIKFSADGKLLFQADEQAITVINVATALPIQEIGLPTTPANSFDPLVSDNVDNILVAILLPGNGIALIDLSAVPEPSNRFGPIAHRTSATPIRSPALLAKPHAINLPKDRPHRRSSLACRCGIFDPSQPNKSPSETLTQPTVRSLEEDVLSNR